MTIQIPTRQISKALVQQVGSALKKLPLESLAVIHEMAINRKTIKDISASWGLSEIDVAIRLTIALCSLHDVLHQATDELLDIAIDESYSDTGGQGWWPMSTIPVDGEVEAYIAAAKHFQDNGQWHDSVLLFVRAADAAKAAGRKRDTASALRSAGESFLEMAQAPNLAEHHRLTFLDSAKSYLEDARSISELVGDKTATSVILYNLAKVYSTQGHTTMAKTVARLSERFAESHGDQAHANKVHDLVDLIEANAKKRTGETALKRAQSDSIAPKERIILLQRAYSTLSEARDTYVACANAEDAVAVDVMLSRVFLSTGNTVRADMIARRAWDLCVENGCIYQIELIRGLMNEINELATRADRDARARQLAEHVTKTN